MNLKDANSRALRAGLHDRSEMGNHEARIAPTIALPGDPLPGLSLRIDNDGKVLAISENLKQRLSLSSFSDTVSLANLMAQSQPWVSLPPAEWPAELPVIKLRDTHHREFSFTCACLQVGTDWLLLLVDVGHSMARLDQHEDRSSVWNRTLDFSLRLQDTRGEIGPLFAHWLEDLSLRLGIAWAAVFLYEKNQRIETQHFFNPELSLSPPDLLSLAGLLETHHHDEPFCTSDFAGEFTWCIPYQDASGCRSWLCLGYTENILKDKWRDINDLSRMFALVVEPALLNLQKQHLAKSLARYTSFEMLSNGGWWEYHPDSDSMHMSRNLLASLGIDSQDDSLVMQSSEWLALIDPADRHELRWKLASEAPFVHNFRFLVEGEQHWFRAEGTCIQGSGKPFILGIALDVNDLQSIEKEAERNTARMMGLVDSAPGIIYLQQYDEGMLTMSFCSGSLQVVLGWSLDEYIEKTYAHFIHDEDREAYFAHLRHLLSTGSSGCQYRIRDKKDNYFWVQDEARLIRDDKGVPMEVIGLCLDITQGKHDTEQIFRSEERYRALVENSPAIIFRYTPDCRISFANNMLYTALRIEKQDDGHVDLREILTEEHYQELRQRIAGISDENDCYTTEVNVRRRDGKLRWWVIYERGIFDAHGTLMEIQAVARDNTEIFEARQQVLHSAKMATLGQMATGLAHEISQPLNVIHMAITNLASSIDSESMANTYLTDKLERVANQVSRAGKIVEHMRIFGRQSDLKGQPFNPHSAVENALSLLEVKLNKDDIDVIVDLPPLAEVVGQPDRLEQVLINLVMNARSAALEKNKHADSRAAIHIDGEVSADCVLLRVKDNGGGIAEEIMDRIFEPFYTTKPAGEGTGLGLSISYAIIKQMSGKLSVRNVLQGAVFTIELPIYSGP